MGFDLLIRDDILFYGSRFRGSKFRGSEVVEVALTWAAVCGFFNYLIKYQQSNYNQQP